MDSPDLPRQKVLLPRQKVFSFFRAWTLWKPFFPSLHASKIEFCRAQRVLKLIFYPVSYFFGFSSILVTPRPLESSISHALRSVFFNSSKIDVEAPGTYFSSFFLPFCTPEASKSSPGRPLKRFVPPPAAPRNENFPPGASPQTKKGSLDALKSIFDAFRPPW
jgi:hypothetical protein